MQQKAVIKVMQQYSEESDLERGDGQGSCLSPLASLSMQKQL
jgi:hypothetical protein